MVFKKKDNKNRGLFITFEGADGCGKTTQINLVKKYLDEKNINSILTFEPGDCEIGIELRKILLHHKSYISDMAELLMYLADRSQHIETVILKNINKGINVLCDRYTDSTVAYQGYARGFDIETINKLNEIVTKGTKPDITFLFDVDSTTALNRVGKNKDRMEKEGLIFHKKVKDGYLELTKKNPERIKVIDANNSIEEVFCEVKEVLDKYYE